MAAFNNLALTVSGIKALLAAQAGTTLTLSKIGMGSGRAANSTSLTGLVTPEAMLPITETKTDSESGCLTIIAKMTNEDITEGFYWRETGLFFEDAEGNDVLFAYACVDTEYDYVPAYSDQRYVKHVRIANIITDSADINIKEAEGLLYVDTLTFEEFKEEVESRIKTVRATNTLKSIAAYLPDVTVQTDIRAVMYHVDSGMYAYTISDNPLITVPDVECNDVLIDWERQDNPNTDLVYGTLTISSMYRGTTTPIIYTCNIYNTTMYTEWKCICGTEDVSDELRSGDIYDTSATAAEVFSSSLKSTHPCWNKWVTVVGQNIAGAPHTGDIWAEIFTGGTTSRAFQQVFSCFNHSRSVWVRFMHDSTWSDWFEFHTSKTYTLGPACAKDYQDSTSAGTLSSSRTGLCTERDIYYGLPTINGSHSYTSSTNIYAPTSVGTKGHVLQSNGSGAPVWVSPGKRTYTQVFSGTGTISTKPGDHMYLTFRATVNGNVMTKTVFLGELGLWGDISASLAHGSSSCNVTITANSITVSSSGASSISGYYMD